MVRLAIVQGLSYTHMAQVQRRWLLPTYAAAYRWTGNRPDAEDLTEWIFHNLGRDFGAAQRVQVVQKLLTELTSEAIVRHWSARYGVMGLNVTASAPTDSRPRLESLLADLTAEMHLALIRRFVRRLPIATIANRLRVPVEEADRHVLVALAQVAERIGFGPTHNIPHRLDDVSAFVTDLVARRPPVRFEARSGMWRAMVAACHIQAAIAGNDLPSRRFVRSLEPASGFVTEPRIWSA
ncbi:MAG TPA: hypothetical protein VGX27_00765 [Candidatus Dormibacteraeota bacterium]|nr:hypothetical protein [Candidatus Dormibacteraeota bacterium]